MPVYNEEAGITRVVDAWIQTLDRLGVRFEFLLYNDGSTDGTRERLDANAARDLRVRVTHHDNRGHGPTILRGYREAKGEWVFQTDSDDEMPPEPFETLWQLRTGHDAVFAIRVGRPATLGRRVLTAGARSAVYLLFGRGPRDVNVPYRLFRRDVLTRLIAHVPDNTFAPNVVLSGLVARHQVRFAEVPVPARSRPLGRTTLIGLKTARVALRAARETLACAIAHDRRPAADRGTPARRDRE
jgi:dolichol-phosphate mannosyltransferase